MNVSYALTCFPKNTYKYNSILKQAYTNRRANFRQKCDCSTISYNLTSECNRLFGNIFVNNRHNFKGHTKRFYSEDTKPGKLPPLMKFPKLVWPSITNSIKNFILSTFIIKPYMDNEFSLVEFVAGSKRAVEVVSKKVSAGDIKSLDGLVTSDVIPNIQSALSLMSLSQREGLAVNVDDIYLSFPYQVGIIFNDEIDQKRFVEITMVHHSLKGLSAMRERGEEPPINMGLLPEFRDKISICNYRFIREYTKDVESDWTVNLLNHFKPSDDLDDEN